MKLFRHMMLAAALAATSTTALADKIVAYTIDPTHSFVSFSWNHVGFSTPSAVFKAVTGTIQGNQDSPEKSSVEVSFPLRSLDTFVPLLNEHLLDSGDWFKTEKFPTVTFKSTGIKDADKKSQNFKLLGDLTVNGVTKPVVLNAHLNKAGPHPFYGDAPAAGFDATTTLKRSDFGVGNYAPMVSDELKVTITVEAIEAKAFQAMLDKQKADAEKKAAGK
ncbi:MAG: YceI family protein [Moraxellaceae bacterium]